MSELEQRYLTVKQQIAQRLFQLGRSESEVCLIVVSKNHDAQLVRELYHLGQRDFGENRDQEAAPKAEATKDLEKISWHFIGQLQSNKVKSVLRYASSIHSIDRQSLVSALANQLNLAPKAIDGFIQLNLTNDPQRGGIDPKDLLAFAGKVSEIPGLNLRGVMGVAALDRDPSFDFETIAKASAQLRQEFPEASAISAGMSHDFLTALEFGATHLRIGSAITGNRNP